MTKYIEKTIGNPVPAWVLYATFTTDDAEGANYAGFNRLEIHPHMAVRMAAGAIAEFIVAVREEFRTHYGVGAEAYLDVKVDLLAHDEPITTLADGETLLLVEYRVLWRAKYYKYNLNIRKVTAQPNYRVYIPEGE